MRKSGWEEKVVTLVTLSHLSIKVIDFYFVFHSTCTTFE